MSLTATVNYHVHKPEQQAFYLDADGIEGNLISPELQSVDVPVADARTHQGSVSFAKDSVFFAQFPT